MKRLLTAVILSAMLLGTAGCGNSAGNTTPAEITPSDGSQAAESQIAANSDEVVSLNVFAMPSNTSGLWEGWAANIIREKVGVQLELLPSGDQGEQKLQALMASGDLPDLVVFKENTQVINAVAGDMLLAFDDYKQYLPNLYENAEPSLRYYADNVSNGKGVAYSVGSTIQTEIETKGDLNWGPALRYDLYKKVGAPAIKTSDDYLSVLKLMQDEYPTNADGQKVYAFSIWKDWDRSYMFQAANLGAINGITYPSEGTLVEIDHSKNNEVSSILSKDSWYLKSLKFYYDANQMGLMDPDSLTQRFDDAQAKGTAGRTLFAWWIWGVGSFNSPENLNNGVGFMQVNAEDAKILHQGVFPTGKPWSWSVSKTSKHPEKAMAFVDAMYNPEIMIEMVNGPKGVIWDVDEAGSPYVLEDGYQYLLDTTLELPGGSNMLKGGTGNVFNANGLHATFALKSFNGNSLYYKYWEKKDFAPADSKLLDEWQADHGADSQIEMLAKKDGIAVAPFANYPILTDDMEQISARVGEVVKTISWQMVFAKDDAEYEALQADMIEKAEGMGINDFLSWYEQEYVNALEMASKYSS